MGVIQEGRHMKQHVIIGCALILAAMFISTVVQANMTRSSSSAPLSEIIDPLKESRRAVDKSPLKLPATVAIVVVPAKAYSWVPATTLRLAAEELKRQLLAEPKYVRSVAIVAGDDVKSKLSLGQIGDLYDADIAVVLSYVQDQRSKQNTVLGVLDLTIVGMYLVPGVTTNTSTIVEGKVVHLPSHAVIFRATGTDQRSTHTTTRSENSTSTEQSIDSMKAAVGDFGHSLTKVIDKFDQSDFSKAPLLTAFLGKDMPNGTVGKPANDYWTNVDGYKSSGGGAWGAPSLLLVGGLWGWLWRRR
jgi:rhombotail lipoprotein